MRELKPTYPSFIASYIQRYLESEAFQTDCDAELGGFHTTAKGARLVMVGPDKNKYEILVNPIFEKEFGRV